MYCGPGPRDGTNIIYHGLEKSFPTEPVSLRSSDIQAANSKMNTLDSLPTAKSIASMFRERQEACVTVSAEQIRTQVCAGSRGLTRVLCLFFFFFFPPRKAIVTQDFPESQKLDSVNYFLRGCDHILTKVAVQLRELVTI